MAQKIKALVFDAYGTLFDVHSVISLCNELFPGKGDTLSRTWRTNQLEYTWLRSLMGQYVDFWHVTQDALEASCKALNLPADKGQLKRLMEAYLHLAPYPEVPEALEALSGYSLAILSNGSPRMLRVLVKNAGLEKNFSEVISVDEVKIFKPSPKVYELAPKKLGVDKRAIGFISSNFWDISGAKSFGFSAFWINRADAASDKLGYRADAILRKLTDLPQHLKK